MRCLAHVAKWDWEFFLVRGSGQIVSEIGGPAVYVLRSGKYRGFIDL